MGTCRHALAARHAGARSDAPCLIFVWPMGAIATRMTTEEYYAITVEGDRKQLVDGEIVVNEPKGIHAALQGRLFYALKTWVDAGPGRGLLSLPTDVRMDEHNVYGPDLLWFSEQNVEAA